MITQRKPRRNAPHEWFKLPSGYSSLSPPMYPLILYAFPANKRVLCFITFCLHGNSFLQSWRARALSLTIGLVARIQYSNCETRPQSLARKGSPTSSHCRSKPHKIIFGAETQEFKVNLGLHPAAAWGHWLSLLLSFSHSPFHFLFKTHRA